MNDVKRCISWVAVSSKPQYEKESPETQRQLNADVARQLGGVISAELIVPGESREYISFDAAANEIAAYRQLREIIANRGADLIIFRDIDRLGRTASLCLQVASECLKGGIALYDRTAPPTSLDSSVQASDHGSIILTAIRSSFSQIEMLKLRQRHQDGMIGRVQMGKFPGNVPYGYQKIFDSSGNIRIEIVEFEARIVRMICLDMLLRQNLAYQEMARQLNDKGIKSPTGIEWQGGMVANIIRNCWRYAGIVELNIRSQGRPYQRVRGDYPAIITDDQAARIESEYKERKKLLRKSPARPYRFSRVCICQECGKPMKADTLYGRPKKDGSKRDEYYRYICIRHKPNTHVTERRLIGFVMAFLADLQSTEKMEIEYQNEAAVRMDEINARIADAENELNQITERRNRLTRAYVDLGAISDAEYQLEMNSLSKRRDALGEALNKLSEDAQRYGNHTERIIRAEWARENGKTVMMSSDVSESNRWLRENMRILVWPDGKYRLEFL